MYAKKYFENNSLTEEIKKICFTTKLSQEILEIFEVNELISNLNVFK